LGAFLCSLCWFYAPSFAQAQTQNTPPNRYAPPPMFGDEGASPRAQPQRRTIILEKRARDGDHLQKPPAPPRKPALQNTASGVVRGAKTMPAVPAAPVVKEVIFAPPTDEAAETETIFERHQKAQGMKAQIRKDDRVIKPARKPNIIQASKAGFEAPLPRVLKRVYPFGVGEITLLDPQMAALKDEVVREFSKKQDWRVMIRAFASPVGEGLNSDKRIALSRAIAIRKALMEGGIDPAVIDIRAEGTPVQINPKENAPLDRIDLYIFDPAAKPD